MKKNTFFLNIFFVLLSSWGLSFGQWEPPVNTYIEIIPEHAPDTIRAGEEFTMNIYYENDDFMPVRLGFCAFPFFEGLNGLTEINHLGQYINPDWENIWGMGSWTTYQSWDGNLPDSFSFSGISMAGWNPGGGQVLAWSFDLRIDQEGTLQLNYWEPDWDTYEYYGVLECGGYPPPDIFSWTIIAIPEVIYVPGDYATIQEAVDHAAFGDTVYVARGVYSGEGNRDIDFDGKKITLLSESGPNLTIIECGGTETESHRGFIFNQGENENAVVDGFTISGGKAWTGMEKPYGGAILCDGASPTIRNCIFENNVAIHGGAIACLNGSSADISYCLLTGNVCTDLGGGIACFGSEPTISNCTFTGNYSAYIWEEYGGGISCSDTSNPVVNNCIFAFNNGGGAIKCENHYSIPFLNCCDITGNVGGDWAGLIANQYLINGNINADPIFYDGSRGLYYLEPTSPCLPENNECNELIGAFGLLPEFICGDFGSDDIVNILDITALVAYLYLGGQPPGNILAIDVDGNGSINILDVTFLINYLYKGGPAPTCVSSSSPDGTIIDHSGCGGYTEGKGGRSVDSTLGCIEYSYDGESTLNIMHRNAGLNCCPVVVADIVIEDNIITIEEVDSLYMGGCACLCLFDIEYQITELESGTYTITFIEPLKPGGDENLEVTVDLIAEPTGMYCVPRSDYPWGY